MPDYSPITAEIRSRIAAVPGLTLIDDPAALDEFGRDKTPGAFHRPELVVEASEACAIQALLRLANDCRFPVVPRGLGTGLPLDAARPARATFLDQAGPGRAGQGNAARSPRPGGNRFARPLMSCDVEGQRLPRWAHAARRWRAGRWPMALGSTGRDKGPGLRQQRRWPLPART